MTRRLKRPPFGGPGTLSESAGAPTLYAALVFQVVPRHQLEKYSTASMGVNWFSDLFSGELGVATLAHLEHLAGQIFGP